MFKVIVRVLLLIKLLILLRYLIFRERRQGDAEPVKSDILTFLSSDSSYQILNQKNVTVSLSPPDCSEGERVLVLVSSGPDNVEPRARWREEMAGAGRGEARLVFLVSTCQPGQRCEEDLGEEHRLHGDILQTSLLDGHRRLGYKILSGYAWAHSHCPGVGHVVKTDDNVVMDLPRLLEVSLEKEPDDSVIVCGSGPPHRNMATKRSEKPGMLGNWTADIDQLPADRVPDFCAGFLYLITPTTGARLAQAGLAVFGDFSKEITLIEDSLITGVLRERLADVQLDMLEQSWANTHLWLPLLSHCPWLTVAKLTFFDELVISKTSDRSGVQYVGSITSPKVWRFFLCLHLEVILLALDNIMDVGVLWDICKR